MIHKMMPIMVCLVTKMTSSVPTVFGAQRTKFLLYSILIITGTLCSRNPRRPVDITIPTITISSTNPMQEKTWASRYSSYVPTQQSYQLSSNFLRLKPIKSGFDPDFFQKHFLPNTVIAYRHGTGIVNGCTLSVLANELIEEIKVGQRHFTHFTVLKDKDFNYKTLSGLIILKYNDYPFVIKISIEHPHTVVQPFSKSYEATGMFMIGGNLRHLSNFTRIVNLQRIKQLLSYNPFYLHSIDFPRKWYWKPSTPYDLKIQWSCNGTTDIMYLPSIYATISDFIYTEPEQPQHELNKLSMKIATDVGFLIDPHAGNILIEEDTRKYILLDTEDFRLMTGLNTSMKAKKYIGWYIELVTNALNTCLFRSKNQRLEQNTTV